MKKGKKFTARKCLTCYRTKLFKMDRCKGCFELMQSIQDDARRNNFPANFGRFYF